MKTSESISKIAPAFVRAQRNIGAAAKDSTNPFFKSKYSDLGSVMEAIKKPLNDEGIAISQNVFSDQGFHFVETVLYHESGEFLSSGTLKLELSKVDMQQLGGSCTYAKRYQLQAMGFVPSEDDDAEGTMNRKPAHQRPVTPPQLTNPITATHLTLPSEGTITTINTSMPISDVPKSRTSFRKPPPATVAPASPAATTAVAPSPAKNLNF